MPQDAHSFGLCWGCQGLSKNVFKNSEFENYHRQIRCQKFGIFFLMLNFDSFGDLTKAIDAEASGCYVNPVSIFDLEN